MEVGTRVVATKRIVEEDIEPVETAGPCEPGWIHAEKGDAGVIVGIDDVAILGLSNGVELQKKGLAVTVRFDKTGTATLIFPEEVRRA